MAVTIYGGVRRSLFEGVDRVYRGPRPQRAAAAVVVTAISTPQNQIAGPALRFGSLIFAIGADKSGYAGITPPPRRLSIRSIIAASGFGEPGDRPQRLAEPGSRDAISEICHRHPASGRSGEIIAYGPWNGPARRTCARRRMPACPG